jgi:O-methyltransferase
MRLDGDLYESTIDAFVNLYPKLSPGGYAIFDDMCLEGSAKAVADYRRANAIAHEITVIDWTGIYWQKRK